MSRDRIDAALDRLIVARRFTDNLLADIDHDDWFWQPTEGVTHVAWQVGHLAFANHGLCMLRVRGNREDDERLISEDFLSHFRIGTTPRAGAENYPPPVEIRRVFDAVHEQSLAELAERSDADLDVPVEKPHPIFDTKLGAVQWCSGHELMHAGQIALLRRLMGKKALR